MTNVLIKDSLNWVERWQCSEKAPTGNPSNREDPPFRASEWSDLGDFALSLSNVNRCGVCYMVWKKAEQSGNRGRVYPPTPNPLCWTAINYSILIPWILDPRSYRIGLPCIFLNDSLSKNQWTRDEMHLEVENNKLVGSQKIPPWEFLTLGTGSDGFRLPSAWVGRRSLALAIESHVYRAVSVALSTKSLRAWENWNSQKLSKRGDVLAAKRPDFFYTDFEKYVWKHEKLEEKKLAKTQTLKTWIRALKKYKRFYVNWPPHPSDDKLKS